MDNSAVPTDIEVNVHERIHRPIHDVFSAIVEPAQMSRYFISAASGPMKTGAKVEWEFADVGAKVAIDVIEVELDQRIVFEGSMAGSRTRMTIALKDEDQGATVVTITEARFPLDAGGVKRAMGQTAGWTYFLACLKGYLQFGINLREGLTKRLTDV